MIDKVKIAAAQIDPKIMENKKNLEKILGIIKAAAGNGSHLVVFPECAIGGYMYTSREELKPYTETIPGPSTEALAACCQELNVHTVVGLLEKDGKKYFNSAVLVGPQGLIGKYRKIHLPCLGADRYVDPGDGSFDVWETPVGNIGIHICFDGSFPESTRVMGLSGADIVTLPTNWPQGREKKVSGFVVNTRALENTIHFVAVNRVGTERNARFLGMSKIANALGDTLAVAGDGEETIYAEVSLTQARQKHQVFKPGEFEVDFIRDRRPEKYGKICSSS